MMHLLGCHGEWLWLLQLVATAPLILVWLRARWGLPLHNVQDRYTDDHKHQEL